MLVRDRGESWQLVRQPDHADLSGQLAAAWGGDGFAMPQHARSLTLAATTSTIFSGLSGMPIRWIARTKSVDSAVGS